MNKLKINKSKQKKINNINKLTKNAYKKILKLKTHKLKVFYYKN